MMRRPCFPVVAGLCSLMTTFVLADSWPQFRGVNSSGIAVDEAALPTNIGPDEHVVWKIETPPGHSSPVVIEDRIFLTSFRDEKLLTQCFSRENGDLMWERSAPYDELETVHRVGSKVQCTPASDGEIVVSFFGSCGLFCYSIEGDPLWNVPMGPFKNDFGAGNSPFIVEDRVILGQDHDEDSFLMAINKTTGDVLWRTDRSEFARNYCTPILWNVDGQKQLVVAGSLRVAGYDFENGKELWTVRGLSRVVCMTPVVSNEGNLIVAGWSAGVDEGTRLVLEPFDQEVARIDKNNNGSVELDELDEQKDAAIFHRFTQADRNKNASVSRDEWERFRELFDKSQNVILAVRPGGTGEITDSHVVWQNTRNVPFCSSPLYYRDIVFMVKDGGILTTLDARTGELIQQGRVSGTGSYYSSPVAGDGKVYLLNQLGQLTVVSAEGEYETLHSVDFGEDVYGTPAIVDGQIFLRTNGHLYCFAQNTEELFVARPLTSEMSFTEGVEGPACDRDGNIYAVNFEKQQTIGKTSSDGATEIFVTLPNSSTGNGIRFDKQGKMYIADYVEHNVLMVDPATKKISVFAHEPKMNQPNDLAISPDGTLWASDPAWSESTGQLWRIDRDGKVTNVAHNMGTTNGIEVSPDGKTLYVNESVQRNVWSFRIEKNGSLSHKTLIREFPDHGFDGMRCDVDGNLYITRHGKGTVVKMTPEGEILQEVDVLGKSPTNVCFGGKDGRTVYVTEAEKQRLVEFRVDKPGQSWKLNQQK
ncbi:MAG: SMP-30/gluconolactonase/LRE family protein [Planctomycetota bacterium]|nr:SMP-30/gluconolactonase/LRE family protein [Planctomycetota bacterium]